MSMKWRTSEVLLLMLHHQEFLYLECNKLDDTDLWGIFNFLFPKNTDMMTILAAKCSTHLSPGYLFLQTLCYLFYSYVDIFSVHNSKCNSRAQKKQMQYQAMATLYIGQCSQIWLDQARRMPYYYRHRRWKAPKSDIKSPLTYPW